MIAPALRERLGIARGSGASFFIGDAEGTPARWSLFLTWLEGLARAGSATAQIVASARATFLAFARWVERGGM
jgi:heme oxygenase